MDHSNFIIAAYAVTGVGMAWLVISSFVSMRRAEELAKDVSARAKDS